MRRVEKFKSGETLTKDIGPKLNQMVDLINGGIRGDGRTISVKELGSSVVISAISQGKAGGNGGSAYSGMFKVTNSTQETDTFPWVTVSAGVVQCESRYLKIDEELVPLLDAGEDTRYLILEITVDETTGDLTGEYIEKTDILKILSTKNQSIVVKTITIKLLNNKGIPNLNNL
jgi:hypothetical protein